MSGSNNSRIGMAHQKQKFDDGGYSYNKNGNPKSKNSTGGRQKEARREQKRLERNSRYE